MVVEAKRKLGMIYQLTPEQFHQFMTMAHIMQSLIKLETLEAVQKYPDVLEITGEYSGGGASRGAAHDLGGRDNE